MGRIFCMILSLLTCAHRCGFVQGWVRNCRTRSCGSVGRMPPRAGRISCAVLPELSNEEIKRYSRHLILPQVGLLGQRRLKASSVLCVGAGGLGSPLLLYLAAAGIGRIGIVDNDIVDVSNLQRQVIHGQSNLGEAKVESAQRRILDINPNVRVEIHRKLVEDSNVVHLLQPYDVVIDGSDNFPTRYLVNDACVLLGKPLVYGAILRFEGQASVFNYQGGPNYRDMLPQAPSSGDVPSCAEGGVFGVLPGVIGGIQATETIKLLTGIGKPLSGRVLIYNALDMSFREVLLQQCCQADEGSVTAFSSSIASLEGQQPIGERASTEYGRMSAVQVREQLSDGWSPFVLDVRLPQEASIVSLPFANLLCPHREVETVQSQLPKDQDILIYCKKGERSAHACARLASLGYKRVINLEGGINAWAESIDKRMPVY